MTATTVSKFDDVIDVRDIIARVEELEEHRDDNDADGYEAWQASDEAEELAQLSLFLEELKGNGGDEQWRGDWYPVTLIRDSYFKDYAQELAEDIGAIDSNAGWPARCIDWDQAARELKMDYGAVEFDGVTYWYR